MGMKSSAKGLKSSVYTDGTGVKAPKSSKAMPGGVQSSVYGGKLKSGKVKGQ
jgi:hypothetical protein